MDADLRRVGLLAAGAVAGYAVVLAFNPARPSLRDGRRCLARYPQIWTLPLVFTLSYSAFTLCMRWYETRRVDGGGGLLAPWAGWQPPAWADVLPSCGLPTAEGAAAVFNYIVRPFPLSVLAALVFLVNRRGYQGVVWRGLRRRFGRFGGGALHTLLLLGALAAALKPALFVGLTNPEAFVGEAELLRWGEVVNAFGFLFEYLLGVGVQIYLIVLCFLWVRGMRFQTDRAQRFALRRFAFVVRWAAVVMAISTLGITLPLVVARFQGPEGHDWVNPTVQSTRWVLAALLLTFCSLQMVLVFHNENLWQALGDHFRLLRRHGLHVGWLVVVAALHFFALALANAFLARALGTWTWPGALWTLLVYPTLWTTLAAWLLASWACLYARCRSDRADAEELVVY